MYRRRNFWFLADSAEEEVYEVIEGELEVTIDGKAQIAKRGVVAPVPANRRHSVRALTDGRLIVVDHPACLDFAYAERAMHERETERGSKSPNPHWRGKCDRNRSSPA